MTGLAFGIGVVVVCDEGGVVHPLGGTVTGSEGLVETDVRGNGGVNTTVVGVVGATIVLVDVAVGTPVTGTTEGLVFIVTGLDETGET